MQNFNDVSHNERWMTQSVTGSGQRADSKKEEQWLDDIRNHDNNNGQMDKKFTGSMHEFLKGYLLWDIVKK